MIGLFKQHNNFYYKNDRDAERTAKGKLMEFLSSAITPSSDQQTSQVVGIDSTALGLPVLPNMNELSVNSVAVSLAAGSSNNVNGNITNQLAAFCNGMVSPETSSTAASNPSVSQLTGKHNNYLKLKLP